VLKGRFLEHVNAVFRTRTGERVFVEGSVNCRTIQGKPIYTRGIFREKGKPDSTRDNGILEVLKSILDAMKEEIIAVDGKGEILYANKAAWKVAGGPEGETGRITSLSDILAPGEDLSAVTRPSGSAGTGEGPAGFRLTMRDGSSRLVETRDLLIQDQPAGSRLMVLKSVK